MSAAPDAKEQLTRSVVLVGLMGAGKTSVGRRLAAKLGVDFVDSDHEIETAAGQTIPEIFANLGESAFRDGERRVIARLLAEHPRVIATGGGAFMNADTRTAIAAQSVSVWLNADVSTLYARVKDKPTRPLLQNPDPLGVLTALADERYPVYAQADVEVLSEPGCSHEQMVQRIIKGLTAYSAAATPVFGASHD